MKKNRKPLPRSTKPIRRSALPRATRPSKRFANLRDPGYCAWIRTHPCLLWNRSGIECAGRTECAHVKNRGTGGADVANTIPLCTRHHREQHSIGLRSFERRYEINLESKAIYFGAIQPPKYGRDYRRTGATMMDADDVLIGRTGDPVDLPETDWEEVERRQERTRDLLGKMRDAVARLDTLVKRVTNRG